MIEQVRYRLPGRSLGAVAVLGNGFEKVTG